MKNALKTLFILSLFLILSINDIYAIEKIDKYDVNINILKTGEITVFEKIEYDFGTLHKHGIFRNLPYLKTNQDGKKFNMTLSNFSVTDEIGRGYTFVKTDNYSTKELELKIGDADKLITGKHIFNISYNVSGALTYFSDHDELYWNLIGTSWDIPIMNAKAEITLPDNIPLSQIKSICYSGSKNSSEQNCKITTNKNKVYVNITKALNPQDGLTVAVSFPKGHVQVLEPEPNLDDLFSKIILFILGIFSFVWQLVVPVFIFLNRNANNSFLNKHKRVVSAWFEAPKREDGSNFSPAETGFLVRFKEEPKLVSSTIIDLAQRGYFKIVQDNKSFIFNRNINADLSVLKDFESHLIGAIFGTSATKSTSELSKSIKFAQEISKFYKKIYSDLEQTKSFEGKVSSIFNKNMVLISLAIFFFNPLLLIVLFLTRKSYVRYTLEGVQRYSEAYSLLNFLSSQDEQLNFQAKNQMFFEKLLSYATVFGVEKVWSDRFKDIIFKESEWISGDMNNGLLYSSLTRSINSSVSSSHAMSTSRSSSGFSSGFSGGSSGGGGGGGGGGSW